MWEEDLEDASRRKLMWLVGAVVIAAIAAGGWYWYLGRAHPAAEAPPVQPAAPQPAANAAPSISHPIPGEGAGSAALPALNDSDPVVRDSLVGVFGRGPVEQFLVPQNVVRHIVVTVDNLPRHKVAVELRPVKPTAGQMVSAGQGEVTTLSEANFERYASLVRVVQGTDVKALAVVYGRLYPLFQQAYEDLGYPGKYFNDRLVEVIDHLLQTPEVPAPIPLVQPKVMWEYADASLENRSAGQKLLIRMGPQNARIIKAKLREFRAEIVNKK
jgi:flagellar basal body-associated protein FliL